MKLFSTILTILLASVSVFAQCTSGTSLGSLPTTAGFQTVPVAAGVPAYYTFTGTAGQTVIFSYCQGGGSTTGDSYLTITDNTPTSLTQNDDFCGLSSELSFVIPSTGTYRVYLSGCCPCSNTPSGTLAFNIPAGGGGIPNDDCSGAISVSCNSNTTGTTVGATADAVTTCGGSPSAPGVWYSFLGNGQTMQANTCIGTAYDSRLAVYSGSCGALTCVTENDDNCGLQSAVTFPTTAGVTYYILVNGFGSSTGAFNLNLSPAVSNDNCATATTITPGSYTGNTTCTGNDVVPFCGTSDGSGGGVWYQITGSNNCSSFTASLCGGAGWDTKIRVFQGTCGALTCVTGIDDACGLQSTVTWNYTPGTTYYILVHGYSSSEGAFTLNVTEANDNVAPIADVATLSDVTAECSVTSLTAPTATDACVGSVTGTPDVTLPITTQGTTVVTWTYNDGNGNTSTQTQNIIIDDVTGPVADVAVQGNFTIVIKAGTFYADEVSWNLQDAGATVVASGGPYGGGHTAGDVLQTVTVPVINDPYSFFAETSGTFNDNALIYEIYCEATLVTSGYVNPGTSTTVPGLVGCVFPGDAPTLTASCFIASLTAPTATDACAGSITGTTTTTLPITGSTTIVWTYDDGNGNITTQNQPVVINDNVAPVADVATLPDLTDECSLTPVTPTATDNCQGTISGVPNVTFPITAQGITVITWTYTDGNGNSTTQTQNVVLMDMTAPVGDLASLADVTAECEVSSLTAPTATDNCGGIVTVTNDAVLPITSQGTVVVTWTYTDVNGNSSSQTQNVIIDDVTPPSITCPSDITVTNDAGVCGAVVTFTTPIATDNCGGSGNILFVSDNADASEIPTALTAAGYTVTSVYNDFSAGDNLALQGSLSGYDVIYWHASGSNGYGEVHNLATMTNLNAFVAAGGDVFVTGYDVIVSPTDMDLITFLGGTSGGDVGPGNNTLVGPNSLTSGYANTVGMSIVAPNGDQDNLDGLLPGVTTVLAGSTATGAEWSLYSQGAGEIAWVSSGQYNGSSFAPWTTPGSGYHEALLNFAFNHGGTSSSSVTVSQTDLSGLTSGDVFPVGTTTIEYTATDAGGNTTVCSFTVTVTDNELPVADAATLADEVSECPILLIAEPTATDNCGGTILGTPDVVFPLVASTTITWTFDDGNGNVITQTQNVIIDDVTAAVPDVTNLADVTAECEVTSLTAPTATDNCGDIINGVHDATLPINTIGTTVVTWTYTDAAGNVSSQTQNVIVGAVDATVTATGSTLTANNSNPAATFQWVDCDNGNAPIAGATNQSYTVTVTGNYAVEVTVGNCTEVSACEFVDVTGLTELTSEFIHVYPNPASTLLNVDTQNAGALEFYDVSGKLIYASNVNAGKTELNVGMLATGTYNVRLTTATGVNTVRVVINRQ